MAEQFAASPTDQTFLERMRQNPEGEARMSFMDHLMELRHRLWMCVAALFVCMVVAFIFWQQLFTLARLPLDNLNDWYRLQPNYPDIIAALKLQPGADIVPLINPSLMGTMTIIMWLGIYTGLVLSSPLIIYELWAFVAPGLRPHERRAIRPVLAGGIVFFLAGCALAYFFLFPITLSFFAWLDLRQRIGPTYTVDHYVSMLMTMMMMAGLVCETPLVVAVLARLGIVKSSHLLRFWRPIVLAGFILGALLSPGGDVISMLLFTSLLLSVYLLSLGMAFIFYKDRSG